jgi:hypothetical protein
MIFINGIIGFGDRVTGEGVVITIVIHGVADIVVHAVVVHLADIVVGIVVHVADIVVDIVVHVADIVVDIVFHAVGIVDQVHMVCDIQRLQAV